MTLQEAIEERHRTGPGMMPQTPFWALLDGKKRLVKTVLQRTAVYWDTEGERQLANLKRFEVDGDLVWLPPCPEPRAGTAFGNQERAAKGRAASWKRRARKGAAGA